MTEREFEKFVGWLVHEFNNESDLILILTLSNGEVRKIPYDGTVGSHCGCFTFVDGEALGGILYSSIIGVSMKRKIE